MTHNIALILARIWECQEEYADDAMPELHCSAVSMPCGGHAMCFWPLTTKGGALWKNATNRSRTGEVEIDLFAIASTTVLPVIIATWVCGSDGQ